MFVSLVFFKKDSKLEISQNKMSKTKYNYNNNKIIAFFSIWKENDNSHKKINISGGQPTEVNKKKTIFVSINC